MPELAGAGARDSLIGGAGADTLSGRDGSDSVAAGAGDDLVLGHGVDDLRSDAGEISAVRVAQGLARPVFAVSAPGDPDRLFIVEQVSGRILILDLRTGTLSPEPFLDLPNGALSSVFEQGLLGLAFHPDYATNGLFYIHLTNCQGNAEIQEYVRQSANRAGAQTDTILTIPRTEANHIGGWIGFGPDRMLYIASGDGNSQATGITDAAQRTDTLRGKILRIDVDRDDFPSDFGRNYGIPADNPFVGREGADEIWMLGLRNPWRASFDPLTGDLWIGDVGNSQREEVDLAPAGASAGLNFGWPLQEGFVTRTPGGTGFTDPFLDYNRTTPLYRGFAVTGGYVNHGPGGAQGLYVFGDYVTGQIWTVRAVGGQPQDFLNRSAQIVISGGGDVDQITSFAVDGRGRLYVIGLDGDIHRLDFGATAGDGGDYLRGDEGNDTILGGVGMDDINGNMGDDSASGGLGDDWVVGGKDNDRLAGDDGVDIVFGNLGDDTLDAGAGADLVRGGQGNDVLAGGAGDDFLSGDRGDDTLTGGAGADMFSSFGDAGLDRVTDFNRAEGDRVRLDPGSAYTASQQGADTVVEIAGGGRVVLVGVTLSTLADGWVFVG